jgi:hypothetical protein
MSSVLRRLSWPVAVAGIAGLAVSGRLEREPAELLAGCLLRPRRGAAASAVAPEAVREAR